jgi:hypothetical protein
MAYMKKLRWLSDIIDIAKSYKISNFVFQSVSFSRTRIPHCASKGMIDKYLADSGISFTILSPGIFMDMLDPLL